jgi:hypothetical protein
MKFDQELLGSLAFIYFELFIPKSTFNITNKKSLLRVQK